MHRRQEMIDGGHRNALLFFTVIFFYLNLTSYYK